MSTQESKLPQLHGHVFVIVRAAWIALVGVTLLGFGLALPYYFQEMRTVVGPEGGIVFEQLTAADAAVLQQLGVSMVAYALSFTVLIAVVGLAFAAIGVLIFWRKSDDWFGLAISFWLATMLASVSPALEPLVKAQPQWRLPVSALQTFGIGFFPIFLYLFPNGRFVPRWLRFLTAGWLAWMLVSPFTPILPLANGAFAGWWISLMLVMALMGVAAQVYRYRRVSTRVQRQQTKWVVFGFGVGMLMLAIVNTAVLVAPALREPGVPKLLFVMIGTIVFRLLPISFLPVTIAISILRYRLWDIDVLIRRTLIYGALTAALLVIYFGSVVLLQQVLRGLTGQQQSEIVTVISTLAIAALFVPLRGRVQSAIDRRFYRRKYDAARTLATFSASVRDEVDLEQVSRSLLDTVNETVQPTHVSLWLKPQAGKR